MKIPFVGPDIEQAIDHTLKLSFLHNFIPIALGLACLISLIYLIKKPSRPKVFLLIGFSLLLLHFEYVKHIMEPLNNQTQVTLITDTPHYGFVWIVDKMIRRGIPIVLFMTGWGSLLGTTAYLGYQRRKERKSTQRNHEKTHYHHEK